MFSVRRGQEMKRVVLDVFYFAFHCANRVKQQSFRPAITSTGTVATVINILCSFPNILQAGPGEYR